VHAIKDNRTSVVDVCDTGPGVSDAHNAFRAFFTTKSNGMGIGLTICRTIIEAHQGRISISEDAHRGAIVSFALACTSARSQ
jgi:two-component system, LuxR family, sensor kinase FixL